jgi:transcriptional regulator GlxA family with amidase domain
MNVEIAVYDGFDELDAIGPYEVLDNGAAEGAELSVSLRTMDDRSRVTASHGLRMLPDGELGETDPDLVIVPGGGWNDHSEAGAWAEAERGDLPDWLADRHAAGVTIGAVCTGGMIVSRAGLLEGRPAITHGGAVDDLRATGAEVIDARVVDDGDVVTAGGVTSGIDLGLYLLEREFGVALAERVADRMEYERRGPIHRAE